MLTFTGGPCVCLETITTVENLIINRSMEGHLYSYIKGHTIQDYITTLNIYVHYKVSKTIKIINFIANIFYHHHSYG